MAAKYLVIGAQSAVATFAERPIATGAVVILKRPDKGRGRISTNCAWR